MREKLIELQHECNKICDETDCRICQYKAETDCGECLRADHLIANGVTLDNQVSSSKWIPVSERLPEQYESVIVWTSDREIGEAEYDGKRFYWTSDDNYTNATHWMPLPEPPKEESQWKTESIRRSWHLRL